jgi:hypothetical protein
VAAIRSGKMGSRTGEKGRLMKVKSEDNIAGHQFRWLRALADAVALEHSRVNNPVAKAERKRQRQEEKERTGKEPIRKTVSLLTDLDLRMAVKLTKFLFGSLECFCSEATAATECGCDPTAAGASLGRLVAAGFLEKLPAAKGEKKGAGRPASRYRVPSVFAVAQQGNEFPSRDGNIKEVSLSRDGILSPSRNGSNKRDDQKGAGAPQAPLPPSSSDTDVELIERVGPVAHERDHPPLPSDGPQEGDEPILDPIDHDIPELPDDVADRFRQADDALPTPEPEADPEDLDDDLWPTEDADSAIDVATRDLQALHGASLDDPRDFVIGFMDAFLMGDPAAVTRAARCVTRLLVEAQSDAPVIWSDHAAIMRRFILATGADTEDTDAAMGAFRSAVSVAGEAIKAERRQSLPEVFAEEAADA